MEGSRGRRMLELVTNHNNENAVEIMDIDQTVSTLPTLAVSSGVS